MKLKLDTLINEGSLVLDRLQTEHRDPVRLALANSRQNRVVEDNVSGLLDGVKQLRKDIGLACGIGEDGMPIPSNDTDVADKDDDGNAAQLAAQQQASSLLLAEIKEVRGHFSTYYRE